MRLLEISLCTGNNSKAYRKETFDNIEVYVLVIFMLHIGKRHLIT